MSRVYFVFYMSQVELRSGRVTAPTTNWLAAAATSGQGLTLVHLSAQRKRFLWERGCTYGVCMGCLGGVRGYQGVNRV